MVNIRERIANHETNCTPTHEVNVIRLDTVANTFGSLDTLVCSAVHKNTDDVSTAAIDLKIALIVASRINQLLGLLLDRTELHVRLFGREVMPYRVALRDRSAPR